MKKLTSIVLVLSLVMCLFAKVLLEQVEALGNTQKEAAKQLGVSISTIRRAGKTIEAYEKLTGKDEQDDESRK